MSRSRRERRPVQLELRARTWGGARDGAGRKRRGCTSHLGRPAIDGRHPVHITVKLDPALPSLRDARLLPRVEDAFRKGKERDGFRLVHYSIQEHHLHLIAEAASAGELAAGIKGLSVRIARGVNRALGRRGRVFVDRYFARTLESPRQTRAALCYVLNNSRRHASQRGVKLAWNWIDPHSSGRSFDGWRWQPRRSTTGADAPPVARPQSWLLVKGWKLCGTIDINEVPGARRR